MHTESCPYSAHAYPQWRSPSEALRPWLLEAPWCPCWEQLGTIAGKFLCPLSLKLPKALTVASWFAHHGEHRSHLLTSTCRKGRLMRLECLLYVIRASRNCHFVLTVIL